MKLFNFLENINPEAGRTRFTGIWDIHCHLLPGVDDGSSCIEETLELIKEEHRQGVRHIIFTPHRRSGMFDVPYEKWYEAFGKIQKTLKGSFGREVPGLRISMGCEWHMHPFSHVMKELNEKKSFITSRNGNRRFAYAMPGEKTILAEFASDDTYEVIRDSVTYLKDMGYRVIIAHAERYRGLQTIEGVSRIKRLSNVFIQINAESVTGRAGYAAKELCAELLKHRLVDFIASDAHRTDYRRVNIAEAVNTIEKEYGIKAVRDLFIENPRKLFIGSRPENKGVQE